MSFNLLKLLSTIQHSLFSKCDVCVKFANERLKLSGDKQKSEQLKREYKEHLDLVE